MREKRRTPKLISVTKFKNKIKIKRERKEELPNELYRNMMIIANGKVSNIVI